MLGFIRNSLYAKLSLVLLGVSLVGLAITAVLAQNFTVKSFEQYLLENTKQNFVSSVTDHYQEIGSWQGVMDSLPAIRDASAPRNDRPPPNQPSNSNRSPPNQADNSRRPPPSANLTVREVPYALANNEGVIVIPGGQYQLSSVVAQKNLDRGTPLVIEGTEVATILLTNNRVLIAPQINAFRASVNRSLSLSAFSALIVALAIGIMLTRYLMRPINAMTSAVKELAKGNTEQVPVTSKDELGVLSQTFNQMTSQLEQSTQVRKQMTADIAHELRSPLTSLGWYLEAIEDGALPADTENMQLMQEQVKQLQHLVEDLRTLSLADTGELSLQLEFIQPYDFLAEIVQTYEPRAKQSGINLSLEAESNLAKLNLDPIRIKQVINNLLDNAIRYTPKDGKITINARQTKEWLELSVQDTGEGITPENLNSIFERFYRADEARTPEHKQSGLGLAIAKAIVEAHGGQIKAESTLNVGSKISILLPPYAASTAL